MATFAGNLAGKFSVWYELEDYTVLPAWVPKEQPAIPVYKRLKLPKVAVKAAYFGVPEVLMQKTGEKGYFEPGSGTSTLPIAAVTRS